MLIYSEQKHDGNHDKAFEEAEDPNDQINFEMPDDYQEFQVATRSEGRGPRRSLMRQGGEEGCGGRG